MYVNAQIEESELNVTALPDAAVVSFDDKDYIFCIRKGKGGRRETIHPNTGWLKLKGCILFRLHPHNTS
ncbi:MAG: hypothetical protein IPN68_17505 [Bacteroidetes bacterium]|nr:hypothetical protein [Bacteroidota bacterium]